jgi:nucleotide-binding universal stress UspA family protein
MKMTAVLIATDGSSTAERAVQIGADIAKSRHMDVILLAVIDKKPIPELIHEGEPDEVILDVANSEKVEMIVMGTRGLGTLKSLVIGSTSRHVAEHAPCSCIIVT